MTEVPIRTPYITLDALLKYAGAAPTGGIAKELILAGEIQVNDAVCLQRGRKLYPGDTIKTPEASYRVTAGEE